MKGAETMISKILKFLRTDIWRIRMKNLPRPRYFLIKNLRVVLLALRGFDEDKCMFKASALTYYTLLSIVPVLAVAFGLAKGFGLDQNLENQITNRFEGHEEVMAQVIDFSNSILENTRGGVVAGVGVAVLFWLVIKVLGNIEKSLNDVWGVKKSRTLWRKLGDYLAIMLICPMLLIVASSVTVFVAGYVRQATQSTELLGAIGPVIHILLGLLPYLVIWMLLTFVYVFLPNTRVNWKSALLAAIITGTAYQVVQWIYINFQIGVSSYNAIYGSFAALPLFLVWIQVSWLIFLFGAEISFAHQNVDTYEFEPDSLLASHSFKRLLALRIVNLLAKSFCRAEKPWNASRISHTLEIPIRLARQLLFELTESGILSETAKNNDRDISYQPAQCTQNLTVQYVIEALDRRGSDDIPVEQSGELERIAQCLEDFSSTLRRSPENVLLRDI